MSTSAAPVTSTSPAPRRQELREQYREGPSMRDVLAGQAELSRGDSGDAVRALQRKLNAAGAQPPLAVDGLFGPKTEAALIGFQRGSGAVGVGRAGAATFAGLDDRATTPDSGAPATAQSAPRLGAAAPPGSTPARDLITADDARRRRDRANGGGAGAGAGANPPANGAGAADNPPAAVQPAAPRPTSSPSSTTLNLPPRPADAMTGSQFIERTKGMSRTEREAFIQQEILRGNVPDFARQMREVQVESTGPDGRRHTGTVRVMPDYLAIGSNDDFVRVPMNPLTAQRIADQTGTSLPTRRIVDEVYRQADVRLTPQPMQAGPQMMSSDYYQRHNAMVESQRAQRGAQLGQLTAGHQKDVVITNQLGQHPDRVAIYGWHQQNGRPIQPLSTIHENTYADYSHGVRLVGGTMNVDGVERPIAEVLRDPNLAGLVSDEGAIRSPRQPRV